VLSFYHGKGVPDELLEQSIEGEPALAAQDGHVSFEESECWWEIKEEIVEEARQEEVELPLGGGVKQADNFGMGCAFEDGVEFEVGNDEVLLQGRRIVHRLEVKNASGGSHKPLHVFKLLLHLRSNYYLIIGNDIFDFIWPHIVLYKNQWAQSYLFFKNIEKRFNIRCACLIIA
jgi:hypothetical protein